MKSMLPGGLANTRTHPAGKDPAPLNIQHCADLNSCCDAIAVGVLIMCVMM